MSNQIKLYIFSFLIFPSIMYSMNPDLELIDSMLNEYENYLHSVQANLDFYNTTLNLNGLPNPNNQQEISDETKKIISVLLKGNNSSIPTPQSAYCLHDIDINNEPDEAYFQAKCPTCNQFFKNIKKQCLERNMRQHYNLCSSVIADWETQPPTLFYFCEISCPYLKEPKNDGKICTYQKKILANLRSLTRKVDDINSHLKNHHVTTILPKENLSKFIYLRRTYQQPPVKKRKKYTD